MWLPLRAALRKILYELMAACSSECMFSYVYLEEFVIGVCCCGCAVSDLSDGLLQVIGCYSEVVCVLVSPFWYHASARLAFRTPSG